LVICLGVSHGAPSVFHPVAAHAGTHVAKANAHAGFGAHESTHHGETSKTGNTISEHEKDSTNYELLKKVDTIRASDSAVDSSFHNGASAASHAAETGKASTLSKADSASAEDASSVVKSHGHGHKGAVASHDLSKTAHESSLDTTDDAHHKVSGAASAHFNKGAHSEKKSDYAGDHLLLKITHNTANERRYDESNTAESSKFGGSSRGYYGAHGHHAALLAGNRFGY